MPKLKDNQIPSYRLHKQSGQAIVTLNSRDFLLGKYGSAASKQEYRRLTAEWLAVKGTPSSTFGTDLTVSDSSWPSGAMRAATTDPHGTAAGRRPSRVFTDQCA